MNAPRARRGAGLRGGCVIPCALDQHRLLKATLRKVLGRQLPASQLLSLNSSAAQLSGDGAPERALTLASDLVTAAVQRHLRTPEAPVGSRALPYAVCVQAPACSEVDQQARQHTTEPAYHVCSEVAQGQGGTMLWMSACRRGLTSAEKAERHCRPLLSQTGDLPRLSCGRSAVG